LKGAVRSTESKITDASNMLLRIPGSVGSSSINSELHLSGAESSLAALIRADGTLTSDTIVVGKALTLSNLAVANSLVGTLDSRVSIVSVGSDGNPCVSSWASS